MLTLLTFFAALFGNVSEKITCPAITESHGTIKRCEVTWGSRQGWSSCEEPVPIGTRALFECPILSDGVSGSSSAVCLHDGTWSRRPLACNTMCGRRDTSAVPLIVNGWEVTREDRLPWHATLFSRENGKWKFFCGGTLIAERVVLTAAHCVWRTSASTIRVVFGAASNELTEETAEKEEFGVEEIEVHDSYQDRLGNYGSDIAVVILKTPVRVNSFVLPACLDWHSDATLVAAQKNEGVGLVAGMGLTENDTVSTTVRIASLRVVSDEECRRNEKRDFRKYLTYTTFCAGWANGTGVCNGDSGGGLVLRRPNTNIWEVHGVVSVSPRKLGTSICDPKFYTVLTKVSIYREWIRGVVEKYPAKGPPREKSPNTDKVIV